MTLFLASFFVVAVSWVLLSAADTPRRAIDAFLVILGVSLLIVLALAYAYR